VQRVRGELLDVATGILSDAASEAASAIKDLLRSNFDFAKLAAARAVLDIGYKQREQVEVEGLRSEVEELKALIKGLEEK